MFVLAVAPAFVVVPSIPSRMPAEIDGDALPEVLSAGLAACGALLAAVAAFGSARVPEAAPAVEAAGGRTLALDLNTEAIVGCVAILQTIGSTQSSALSDVPSDRPAGRPPSRASSGTRRSRPGRSGPFPTRSSDRACPRAGSVKVMDRLAGRQNALSPVPLAAILLGVVIGLVFGAVPGLGATVAVASCLPLTFGMGSVTAMSPLVPLSIGGVSGGPASAILIGIAGPPSSIATTFDGRPTAPNGETGRAILFSFVGGLIGIRVLFLFARCGTFGSFAISAFARTLVA